MLAENRSRLIGVLIGEREGKRRSIASDPFTSVILNSLELEIYRQNYYMLFHLANSQEESWKLAATWKVEGPITLGLSSEENLELSEKCQIPLVSIDNYYGEKKVANIGLQDFEGGMPWGNSWQNRDIRISSSLQTMMWAWIMSVGWAFKRQWKSTGQKAPRQGAESCRRTGNCGKRGWKTAWRI
ncbi:hypothetical protein LC724_26515 [Blautia sp. RD014234]|nr:hypothetical protein [Blautia parvula]